MNIIEKTDEEILELAHPMWADLIKFSNEGNYGAFTRNFSSNLALGANEVEMGKQFARSDLAKNLSENYEYLGGIIAPGVETSAAVLHRYAARLPKVEMKFPDELIGRTTETSIQSGLMFGIVELIDGMIARIQTELGKPNKTVATGGLANLIIPHSKKVSRIEPFLTLEGLRMIYEKIRS